MRRAFSVLVLLSLLAACTPAAGQSPDGTAAPTSTSTITPTAAASATLTPSAIPEDAPDLSGETISLGLLCDNSSQFAEANRGRVQGVQDVVAAINAEGGIFGAELTLEIADTRGTPEGAASALERIQQAAPPLVLVCDALSEQALAEALGQAGLPALSPGAFEGKTLFPLEPTPTQQIDFAFELLSADWQSFAPTGAEDAPRVALIIWPEELTGHQSTHAFSEELVMKGDLADDPNANVFDLIYMAREANANVIFTNARGYGLAALLNGLHVLGLRDRFAVVVPAMSYDVQLLSYLQDASYADGLYLVSSWDWWSRPTPGIQAALDLRSEGSVPDWGYLQMAGATDIARRALEDAILEEGLSRLGTRAVSRALQALTQFPALNGLAVIDYSANASMVEHLRLWQVTSAPLELEVVAP